MNNNENHHELVTLLLLLCVLLRLSGGRALVTFVFAQQGLFRIRVKLQATNCRGYKSGDQQEAAEGLFDSFILRQKIKGKQLSFKQIMVI